MRKMGITDLKRVYTERDLAPGPGHPLRRDAASPTARFMRGVRFFGGGLRTSSLIMSLRERLIRFVDTRAARGRRGRRRRVLSPGLRTRSASARRCGGAAAPARAKGAGRAGPRRACAPPRTRRPRRPASADRRHRGTSGPPVPASPPRRLRDRLLVTMTGAAAGRDRPAAMETGCATHPAPGVRPASMAAAPEAPRSTSPGRRCRAARRRVRRCALRLSRRAAARRHDHSTTHGSDGCEHCE